jgi:hypothetical protein
LDLGFKEQRDIWLTYLPNAKRVARIQAAIAWVTRCFDPRRYPWFRDEFIEPNRLSEAYKGPPLAAKLENYQR